MVVAGRQVAQVNGCVRLIISSIVADKCNGFIIAVEIQGYGLCRTRFVIEKVTGHGVSKDGIFTTLYRCLIIDQANRS